MSRPYDRERYIRTRDQTGDTYLERVEAKVHKGSENGRSKLTDDQVREIRSRYVPQVVSLPMLGREYGVSAQVIFSIVKGKRWTHVQN